MILGWSSLAITFIQPSGHDFAKCLQQTWNGQQGGQQAIKILTSLPWGKFKMNPDLASNSKKPDAHLKAYIKVSYTKPSSIFVMFGLVQFLGQRF